MIKNLLDGKKSFLWQLILKNKSDLKKSLRIPQEMLN
jgi:hypothetical protein